MHYIKSILMIVLIFISAITQAKTTLPAHKASKNQEQRAVEHNKRWRQENHYLKVVTPYRPVEDTALFSYVLMSAFDRENEEVINLRKTIAQNLPNKVRLVLLADTDSADAVRTKYLQWISEDRLIIATDKSTINGFWARDSFPVPVYDNQQLQTSLIASYYFKEFSSWNAIANTVNAPIQNTGFTFVGGNLLADEEGNCFVVDSRRLFSVNEQDLKLNYGCQSVHFFPHLRGIGDIDEVLKPLPGKLMLTNTKEYRNRLEELGYQVIMLPALKEPNRTYVNSLIVHNVVFMPSYNTPEDKIAQKTYENLGYTVYPILSMHMSDEYGGSIHCQTMAYPAIEIDTLLESLNLKEYKAVEGIH